MPRSSVASLDPSLHLAEKLCYRHAVVDAHASMGGIAGGKEMRIGHMLGLLVAVAVLEVRTQIAGSLEANLASSEALASKLDASEQDAGVEAGFVTANTSLKLVDTLQELVHS